MWFSFSTESGFDQNSLLELDIGYFLAFFYFTELGFGDTGFTLSFKFQTTLRTYFFMRGLETRL